jgi:ABC-type nitrate/sulfonate/bicarbonate transport system substrate-binding protein
MRSLKLAYRDDDRTPVIFCIKEMARRHYDLEVEVVQIVGGKEYEAALFNGSGDVIIEHLEYLYAEAAKGKKIAMFCAPSKGGALELVAPGRVSCLEDLRGGTLAVRSSGQPHAVTLWLKMVGLEREVRTLIVADGEVGRWGQWKKVASGECIATFISPLYLSPALRAGLKVLPAPHVPVIGHFAQACLSRFARENSGLLRDYVKAVIHALCWMTLSRDEALEVVSKEPMERMKIKETKELKRQFDSIVRGLKTRPCPTLEAVANTFEIATLEYPGAKGLNPLSVWDLHWVKELDDEGFIDSLIEELSSKS